MDVDHVAFAARDKFDGMRMRPMRADEAGQIAGRAGRYMNDGTFGVTGDCEPFEEELDAKFGRSSVEKMTIEQAVAQDILLCVNTGRIRTDPTRMRMESTEFYLKSPAEMDAAFADIAGEFMENVFDLLPGDYAITDESTLRDFTDFGSSHTSPAWRRITEGYGPSPAAFRHIRESGSELVITVDCGITAVAAAARAQELGLALIVTDHHRHGDALPDCPVVAPAVRGTYPFDGLCGAGTAVKLLEALVMAAEADPAILDRVADLDRKSTRLNSSH